MAAQSAASRVWAWLQRCLNGDGSLRDVATKE